MKFLLFILISIKLIQSMSLKEDHNVIVLEDFEIKSEQGSFPNSFSIDLGKYAHGLRGNFEKIKNYNQPEVKHFLKGKITDINFGDNNDHQLYKEKDGKGFATLFSRDDKLRMYARLFDDNKSIYYDIIPKNEDVTRHFLHRRNIKREAEKLEYSFGADEILIPNDAERNYPRYALPKDCDGINEFDVEILAVIDPTVYEDHKKYLNTDDDELIFQHIRTYYAHTFNGVNDKYQNTLKDDPQIRINIKLTNVMIVTDPQDAPWTMIENVGVPDYPSYNGKEVIDAVPSLNALRLFISLYTQNLSRLNIDHVIGIFNKDLWFTSNGTPEERSATLAVAYTGGICDLNFSFSLTEEIGGFWNIYPIAHELGHNLGSLHDGYLNPCKADDHFIMSPSLEFPSMANMQIFSECSVKFFKHLLLYRDQPTKESMCLLNYATEPDFVKEADSQFTGQFWDLDQQCKMIHGANASFCREYADEICSGLYCRPNFVDDCTKTSPAVEGTTCASGSICVKGYCTEVEDSLESECPFGDGLMPSSFIDYTYHINMKCEEFIDLLNDKRLSVIHFCNGIGKIQCCSTCLKYKPILECNEKYSECPQAISKCESKFIDGFLIKENCPLTCNNCPDNIKKRIPLNCFSDDLCRNGGECIESELSNDKLIAYSCKCPEGYTGKVCETKMSTVHLKPKSTTPEYTTTESTTKSPSDKNFIIKLLIDILNYFLKLLGCF